MMYMPILVGTGFLVIAAVVILQIVGKIFQEIYGHVKTVDSKPVEQYIEMLKLTQELRENNPELAATAVRNTGLAEGTELDQFGLLKLLKSQKEMKKEKTKTTVSIVMTFMLGMFTTLMVSGLIFIVWVFW